MARKSVLQWAILTVAVLFGLAGLTACITKHEAGAVSLATLSVNGPGIDGVVFTKAGQFYTLSGITAGQQYTLRTMISSTVVTLASGGTTTIADGTLTIKVYRNESAYKNNEPEEFTINSTNSFMTSSESIVYEWNFTAQYSDDYVAVINGESLTIPGEQFFYDLRLMSGAAITSFATPTNPAFDIQTLESGYINIYNVNDVSPGIGYFINLASDASSTIEFPQMFLYADASLTTDKLLLSSIPTTTYFEVTQFQGGVQIEPSILLDTTIGDTIYSWTLTSPTTTPYVVIRGIASSASYTLTVQW